MTLARTYRRGGISLRMGDVKSLAPYLTKSTLSSRLERWEMGKLDCDELLRISDGPGANSSEFGDLGLGPRRRIEDIKISAYERRLNLELENRSRR